MKKLAILFSFVLLSCCQGVAEENVSVEHTSANHTTIVIHNTSPEAMRERNERAREAGRRLEIKRQQRHEQELARIEAEGRQAKAKAQARAQARQPKIYRKKPYQPAPFMNGGVQTIGFGFGSFPSVGYGYGGYGGYGYAPRPYAYRGGNRSCRPRPVSRGFRCRPTPRPMSRPVGRVSRGRRCR